MRALEFLGEAVFRASLFVIGGVYLAVQSLSRLASTAERRPPLPEVR
jgi:hypothetical protein